MNFLNSTKNWLNNNYTEQQLQQVARERNTFYREKEMEKRLAFNTKERFENIQHKKRTVSFHDDLDTAHYNKPSNRTGRKEAITKKFEGIPLQPAENVIHHNRFNLSYTPKTIEDLRIPERYKSTAPQYVAPLAVSRKAGIGYTSTPNVKRKAVFNPYISQPVSSSGQVIRGRADTPIRENVRDNSYIRPGTKSVSQPGRGVYTHINRQPPTETTHIAVGNKSYGSVKTTASARKKVHVNIHPPRLSNPQNNSGHRQTEKASRLKPMKSNGANRYTPNPDVKNKSNLNPGAETKTRTTKEYRYTPNSSVSNSHSRVSGKVKSVDKSTDNRETEVLNIQTSTDTLETEHRKKQTDSSPTYINAGTNANAPPVSPQMVKRVNKTISLSDRYINPEDI